MRLLKARVQNFRSLKDVTINFGSHTAFIGGNGAGKSSILKALEKFYSTAKNLDVDDFYGRDTGLSVEIELTFGELGPAALAAFESRVRDGQLIITRIFDQNGSGRYHGVVPQHPGFRTIREAGSFNAKRTLYNDLRQSNERYANLSAIQSQAALDSALAEWETLHPDQLETMRDSGQFFGFQNAGRGTLQNHTSFVFIPAVREAAIDASDARSSPIAQLLELVVRSAILQRADLREFQARVNAEYQTLTSAENMPELGVLGTALTTDLRRLYDDAAVGLTWRPSADMTVPLPTADVSLTHDGFGGPVDKQGHGLQRAFVFTLLQRLARATHRAAEEPNDAALAGATPPVQPSIFLAIEEPELYQHPTKQRHLSSVLRKLSEGTLPGAEGNTQIAFASHSPLFVSMPHVGELRFVRRVDSDGGFKECELRALDLSEIARQLEHAAQRPVGSFTAESLQARLHILGPELSEGFFASGVILVEGRSDKAALCAIAAQLGLSFEAAGIAILSAEGKPNIDRPLLVFRELGIPTFAIWDCDVGQRDHRPDQNLLLLRASDPGGNHVQAPTDTHVANLHAYFAVKLERTMRDEIGGAIYDSCMETVAQEFGASGSDAQKNPEVMKAFMKLAAEQGASCPTLERIVRAAWDSLTGAAPRAGG